jgi:sensor histidine kinase regulating citrate/malate metabolism
MEQIDISFIFLFLGGLGLLLLVVVFLRSRQVLWNKQKEDQLCTLFFEQHAFLFKNKQKLFAYDKVKELTFFQKNKLFESVITNKSKQKYLTLAQTDMTYLEGLLKEHTA